jgi:ribonuclease H-related protein
VMFIDGEKITKSFAGTNPDFLSMNNVGAEIDAAMWVMEYCVNMGIKEITLFHDYTGVADWCTGVWDANTKGTKAYKKFYDEKKEHVNIKFQWVKGHRNNKFNEEADLLAKAAIGL